MTPQAASAAADNLAPLRPVLARAPSAPAAQPGAAAGFAAFLMVSVGLPGQASTQQQAPEPPSFPEPPGLSGAPGAVIPPGPAGAPGPAAMPPAPDLGPVLMSAARVPSMDGKAKAVPSDASNGQQADSTPAVSPALEGAVPLPANSALAHLQLQAAAMPAERVPEPPSAAGQDPTREEPPMEPASITAVGGPVEGPVRAAPGAGALAAPSGQPTPGVAAPSARTLPAGVTATTAAPPQSAMQPGSRAVAQASTDRTEPVDALAGHPAPATSGTLDPMPPDVANPGADSGAEPGGASRGRMPEGPVKPVDPSGPQPAPAAPPRPASTPAAPAFEAPQPAATAVALANAMTGRAAPLEPPESEGKPAESTDASVPVAGTAVLPRPAAPPPLPVAGPMSPADSPALPLAGQLGPAFTTLAPPAGPARLVVRLDPAELGQVQVGITRPANGPTRVELMAERPDTLLLLMRDQPALNRALDLAGVPAEGRTLHFQLGTPDAASPAPAQQAAPGNNLGSSLGGSGLGQGSPGGAGSGMAGGGQGQPQGWPGGADNPGNMPAARMRRPGHPQAGIDITA